MTGKKNFQEYMAERLVALEAERQSAISVAARAQAIIRTRKVQVVKVYLEGSGSLDSRRSRSIGSRGQKGSTRTRELGRDPHMLDTAGDDSKKTYRRVQAPPVMEETAVTLRGLVDEIDRWNLGFGRLLRGGRQNPWKHLAPYGPHLQRRRHRVAAPAAGRRSGAGEPAVRGLRLGELASQGRGQGPGGWPVPRGVGQPPESAARSSPTRPSKTSRGSSSPASSSTPCRWCPTARPLATHPTSPPFSLA